MYIFFRSFVAICFSRFGTSDSAAVPFKILATSSNLTTQHGYATATSNVFVLHNGSTVPLDSVLIPKESQTVSATIAAYERKDAARDEFLEAFSVHPISNSVDSLPPRNGKGINTANYSIRQIPPHLIPMEVGPSESSPSASERRNPALNFKTEATPLHFPKEPTNSPTKKDIKRDVDFMERQLDAAFKISKPALHPLLRCAKPEAAVSVKCLANFARLVFLSESYFSANVKLLTEKPEASLEKSEVRLHGHHSVLYIAWSNTDGRQQTSLNDIVTSEELKITCRNCRNKTANLLLHEEDVGCVISVNCSSQESEMLLVDEGGSVDVIGGSNEVHAPIISAALSLQNSDNKGHRTVDKVRSGQRLAVSIKATSFTLSVGLFVKQCHVKISNGPQIPLLSNGCSISNLLEDFKVTPYNHSNKIPIFNLFSSMIVYSPNNLSQLITFECRIMICDGLCDVNSSCQSLSTGQIKPLLSRVIFERNLRTTMVVEPDELPEAEPAVGGVKLELQTQFIDVEKSDPGSFVSKQKYYASIFILSCIYLAALAFCVVWIKHSMARPKVYRDTEVESTPTRSPNFDNTSTRRRSPPTAVFLN